MAAAAKSGDNFIVAVRVRPLIPKELPSQCKQCVEVDDSRRNVIIQKPDPRRPSSRIGIEDLGELVRGDSSIVRHFSFDIVLDTSTTQTDVFNCCAQDVVTSVLKGYNGSIIASGQTDSGKTYTIEGGTQNDKKGIIPRATELIFSQTCSSTSDQFLVRTSFVEIYNEKISDLLDHRGENLKLREDGVGGFYVDCLSEHIVRNTSEVMKLLQRGTQQRTTAMTKMNKESSRSHAVFTIIVEHAKHDIDGGNVTTIGKLRLVDLAGSERLDVDAQSKQQEETKNINVSLHTFSKVVTALTTPSMKHVPYRDSKLTRLLQDCLGGNCRTTLIATITPVSSCYNESLNTLRFAKRAKSIKNTALVNKDMSQKALLSSYQAEIKKLKHQLQERDKDSNPEVQKLLDERLEAQKEQDEVKTKLEIQQKIAFEARADKDKMMSQIHELENMLLQGGDKKITDSEEFKEALMKEQERLKKETATEYKTKLAELEVEKLRLEQEKLRIEEEKAYLSKMKNDTDSREDDISDVDKASALRIGHIKASIQPRRSSAITPAHRDFHTPRRIRSTEALQYRSHSASQNPPWIFPTVGEQGVETAQALDPRNPCLMDSETASALHVYAEALAHPRTGIPSQELMSGITIFTGTAAVQWFMKNMEGVSSMQSAQGVGQRLMDLGVFTEIQGGKHFVVSSSVYYQFCQSAAATPSHNGRHHTKLVGSKSLGSFHTTNSMLGHRHSSPLGENIHKSSSTWTVSSTATFSQSSASLAIEGNLLEHFGLSESCPTEFHIAALYGERSQLKVFMSQGNINITDSMGRTPLMYAVIGKQAKCCILLIRNGADVNGTDSAGYTSLLLAAKYEYEDIIKVLMKNGAQTHFADSGGSTAFHLAAGSQNYKCLEYLCKYGSHLIGINMRDNNYRTPLHISVLARLPGQTKRLLMAKADMGVSDEEGRTALHYAVTCKTLPCVQAIVDTSPNDMNLVDTSGSSVLHFSCREGPAEIVSYLSSFQNCDINLQDQHGRTPLHISVMENRTEVIKLLLLRGANVAIKDNTGKTPLHYGIELGYADCVRALQIQTE